MAINGLNLSFLNGNMVITRENYLAHNAERCGKSIKKYLKDLKHNYIIYCNSAFPSARGPVCWGDTHFPVVYGGIEDAKIDATEKDDIIMTEEEYLNNFLDNHYIINPNEIKH